MQPGRKWATNGFKELQLYRSGDLGTQGISADLVLQPPPCAI